LWVFFFIEFPHSFVPSTNSIINFNTLTMKLSKLFALLILANLTLFSCKKDEGSNNDYSINDYEGYFTGIMTTEGISNPLEGVLKTSSNGTFTLNLLSGSLQGSIESIDNTLRLDINQRSGIFYDSTSLTGTLSQNSEGYNLSISGTYIDGNPLNLNGQAVTLELGNQAYHDSKTKSSVYFTHNESCKAVITIGSTTLGDLNNHYAENGLCNGMYASMFTWPVDVENEQSQLDCHTVRLRGLDGNYFTFEDCNTATFILPKNTQYSYFVQWENGETETGNFTSPDGASRMAICLENSGPECSGNGNGNLPGADGSPRFNMTWSGSTDLDLYVTDPLGFTIYYSSTNSPSGGVLDVDCTGSCTGGNAENITWENGGPSGVYEFHVNYYSGSGDTPFTITVRDNDTTRNVINSSLSDGDSQTWTYTKN